MKKVRLSYYDITRMIDLSAVGAEDTEERIKQLAARAREIKPVIATTLSSQILLIRDLLQDVPEVGIGGNVGFPSGGHLPKTKIAETKHLLEEGCNEIDMVIDIGKLRSGRYDYCCNDIKGVVEASEGLPVKVILECHYLTDDQIKKAVELCIKAGASFVKTGTGWTPAGATLENIALIKTVAGNDIEIKASGGIRDLETIIQMYSRGARRFGIGLGNEEKILDEMKKQHRGVVELNCEEHE